LQDLEGISDKTAKKLIWDARDILHMTDFTPVTSMKENFEYITTGSTNLDKILGGGISTRYITEVFGAFKSGKTNLSHTICVTTQLPKAKGGLDGAVLFIDTENTFSKVKIERIAKRFGLDPIQVLQNIYHCRIYSCDHQLQMARAAEAAIKAHNARLIIVDSLMAMFRSEYVGIGMLATRQQMVNKLIHDLSRLAETYNVAVLCTNQVTTVMKGPFTSQEAIGGNIVAHGCHIRLQFKYTGFAANTSLERQGTIVDAPDLPPETASFFITEAGISDTETVLYEQPPADDEASEEVVFQSADQINSSSNLVEIPDEILPETVEKVEPSESRENKGKTKSKSKVKPTKKSLEDMIESDPLAKINAALSGK
jgi:DNA repair protein RadA